MTEVEIENVGTSSRMRSKHALIIKILQYFCVGVLNLQRRVDAVVGDQFLDQCQI